MAPFPFFAVQTPCFICSWHIIQFTSLGFMSLENWRTSSLDPHLWNPFLLVCNACEAPCAYCLLLHTLHVCTNEYFLLCLSQWLSFLTWAIPKGTSRCWTFYLWSSTFHSSLISKWQTPFAQLWACSRVDFARS